MISGWLILLPAARNLCDISLKLKEPQGQKCRRILTADNVALVLWCMSVLLLVAIPKHYWQYRSDLWLRVAVMVPAIIAVILLMISRIKKLNA